MAGRQRQHGRSRPAPGPSVEAWASRGTGDLIQGVHPLGQVVEVLAVAVPLQAFIEGLIGTAFRKLFADAQPGSGWMRLALLVAEPTEPTVTRVTIPMSPQRLMDLIDQLQGKCIVLFFTGHASQTDKVAYGEGVCPEIALPGAVGRKPRTRGEAHMLVG